MNPTDNISPITAAEESYAELIIQNLHVTSACQDLLKQRVEVLKYLEKINASLRLEHLPSVQALYTKLEAQAIDCQHQQQEFAEWIDIHNQQFPDKPYTHQEHTVLANGLNELMTTIATMKKVIYPSSPNGSQEHAHSSQNHSLPVTQQMHLFTENITEPTHSY